MKQIKISQVDALFTNGSYPIEFLLYYGRGFSTKRLRASLKRLSSSFWPAFGEYREGMICFERYLEEDHYDEEFREQELDITELQVTSPEVIRQYALSEIKSLFFLKVIRYRNGTILIPRFDQNSHD